MEETIEIIVKGKGSDISIDFYEPLNIPMEHFEAKLGVKSFSTYNSIPNVVEGKNNRIRIKVPGEKYKTFALETGAYELDLISTQIMEWMGVTFPKLQDLEENFKILANYATSKADFIFKGDYGVDFAVGGSMHELLGFDQNDKIEGTGRYSGKRVVNITNVTQLVFNCNITKCNYINGREMPFLYSCGINVPVGFRLCRELTDITYKGLNTDQISHIRIWVVNEEGESINLRSEDLNVTLSLKLTPRVTTVTLK